MEQNNTAAKGILNTTLVEAFTDKSMSPKKTEMERTESLLETIASNQVLLFEEVKRKNKYEAWRTFFAGTKLVIYILIIYVSYLGALQLLSKIESGELTKNLIPSINLEEVVSNKSTGKTGLAEIVDSFGDLKGEDASPLISSFLDRLNQ